MDLSVDARRTGFETHLVINTPAALAAMSAAGSGQVSWQIPVKTKGLTARANADGSVSFVDGAGTVASSVAAPVAWDAAVDARSGNRVNESPVRMTVAQRGKGRAVLTLTPDQGWLVDPARVFPITIDPTYASGSIGTTFDTYVSSAYPTSTYSTATELRVGTYNGGGDVYRSFLTFPITALRGLDVVSANVSLYEFYSWSCTAYPFYVHTANGTTSATTWNTQPAPIAQWGSLTTARGYSSSCAEGRVSVPITGLAQTWSKVTTYNDSAIRLSASETDNYGWKKFYSLESSQDPYVTYTYNRRPNIAAAPTMSNGVTYNGSTYVAYGSTTVTSTATDPDGSTVQQTFEVHNDTTGSAASKISSCVTSFAASGARASCNPSPSLPDNATLYVRSAVMDDRNLWNGNWSPWTTFKTALSKPAAPSVSCPGYPNGSWSTTSPTSDVACTVTVPAASGANNQPVRVYVYVDGATTPTIVISTNQTAGTFGGISVPKRDGGHSVTVMSATASTWSSDKVTTSFGWGNTSLNTPTAGTTSTGMFTASATAKPQGNATGVSATVQWRKSGAASDTADWSTGTAAPSPHRLTPAS
ncbi:DNRLRE domain-containing protein [Pedococcus sp. NPDC057267]|uniref:DNRLRE domain-containing protein n=1 Tax=Pedococcus sp. NPDC057267 TaxID=3346077 RepID=UPI00363AEE35